jgi:phosphoglucosamine mutase
VGTVVADPTGASDYFDHLVSALQGRRLDGLSVVLDCAHGAAFEVAPAVFGALGATVHAICADPDGTNINAGCGSTRPEGLASTVLATGADFGLAFDGDADRLVAVDHAGQVVHGDALMALFAVELHARGELTGGAVAVTIMSNLGFRLAMEQRGIDVIETPVGDRHVLAAIDERGLALGGEQSGHIVFRRMASTGDGVLSGLLLADAVAGAGRPLAELAGGLMEWVPQVLVNVAVEGPGRLHAVPEVWEAVARAEAELQGRGRVLLRPSGTEPLVRVMVEAPTEALAAAMAQRLSEVVQAALGDR